MLRHPDCDKWGKRNRIGLRNGSRAPQWGEAGEWAKSLDEEVYAFVGLNLHRIAPDHIDVRWMYNDTRNDKKAGMDWKKLFWERMGMDPVTQVAADLCQDEYLSAGERKAEFCSRTGMSDQTFWDIKRKLEASGLLQRRDGRGKSRGATRKLINGVCCGQVTFNGQIDDGAFLLDYRPQDK